MFISKRNKEEMLMNKFETLKKALDLEVKNLDGIKSLFVMDSESNFTRNRKLSFVDVINTVITLEAGSMKDELLKKYMYSIDTPSSSAFIQARDKVKVDAFQHLFNKFNDKTKSIKSFKGYRLLAIDGSELPIDNTIYDEETTLIKCNQSNKQYSAFHLNALYDLLEYTYDDVIIQGEAKKDENGAFCDLVDRYKGEKAIFIADRGYESYNGFEHVVKSGNKYLIRVKDIKSKTSMARSFGPYSSNEFDIEVHRTLTLRNTNEIKAHPEIYKFCPQNMRFDYMDKEHNTYEFSCRIVRFKLDNGTYETIITNLDKDEFDSFAIKELYHMRWGIETSFRKLKYAIGLNALHSKKRNLIKQEIYAQMILYNLCQRIVTKIKVPKSSTKYEYQLNYTRAIHIIREFIKKKTGGAPPVDNLIAKELLPIRPGRSDKRNVKSKSPVCFNYRFD